VRPEARNCHTCAHGGARQCTLGTAAEAVPRTSAQALLWRQAADPMLEGVPVTATGCPGWRAARLVDAWWPSFAEGLRYQVHGVLFGHPELRDGQVLPTGEVIALYPERGRVVVRSSSEKPHAVVVLGNASTELERLLKRPEIPNTLRAHLTRLAQGGLERAACYHASLGAGLTRAGLLAAAARRVA